ncbi:FAD-binding protein [Herbiconiux daphne]|uniref:FAD-binding protein n=1 Tax=Herbiconiux daphne TaxID=2970914 RepID=A0ABT2H7T0_9MICO|nr:FAD-binding protein [Herbiconiux daphne]MCS5735962.1 FAD-binding protein [Herbiconiux daphne]
MTANAGANWAGVYSYRAPEVAEPRTVSELQSLVASSHRVRALGTRHSFNDIADTSGVLVSTLGLEPVCDIDPEAMTVTVSTGTRYGELAAQLQAAGFALHNMGSLPHISVGGACSTATHGSGVANGNLATAVSAVELVTAGGALEWIGREDAQFPASVVALGAFGVATRFVLDVEPTFEVRQDIYEGLSWQTLLDDPDAVLGAAYSVSVFTDWTGDRIPQVWLKTRFDGGSAAPGQFVGPDRAPEEFFDAVLSDDIDSIAGMQFDNLTERGSLGPWSLRLPHFRLDSTPSNGDEIQTEYFVARSDSTAALTAVRALSAEIAPHLLITELRTVAADDLWLSPAFERDSLAIHFTWRNQPDDVARLLPRIEEVLAPFEARPHWGKWFAMGHDTIAGLYPRLPGFRALALELDPQGVFGNDYLARTIGLGA